MAEKTRLRRTISQLGYAPITAESDAGTPTYGEITWLVHNEAGGREYDMQPYGDESSIWADGVEVYAAEDNQGYNTVLTTLNVVDDIDKDWYGRTVLDDGSVEEYADGKEFPHMALIIIEDTTDGVGETTIFYDAHITTRAGKQGATSEGTGLNPQFPEHTFACRPRKDCKCVMRTLKQKELITEIPEPSKAAPHVTIRQKNVTVAEGNTVKLNIAEVYPEDASVTWSSSATSKASVSTDGTVTGADEGTAVITASITVGGTSYTDTCNVTVTA